MLKCKTFWIYMALVAAIYIEMVSLGYSVLSWQCWIALGCVIGAFQCGRFDERNGGKQCK